MTQTALILGANGRFGRHAALAFENAGWQVTRFDRRTDDLDTAARRTDVIVNAWNPLYTDWARQVPDLHGRVIRAAKAADATVIVPGNVYVFGAETAAPWSGTSPHRATNSLGRIRIEMERAYRDSGVRTIILRAGDFLDTEASDNWFDKIMISKLKKGVFTYPGNPDIPHAWAFLPDMCRAAVLLAEQRADLPVFNDIPFAGYTLSGQEAANLVDAATPYDVRLKQLNWLPVQMIAPLWKMGRLLLEMRYLWNTPHWLDDAQLKTLLPDFTPTPPAEAFRQSVQGAGFTITSTQTNRWRLADSAAS